MIQNTKENPRLEAVKKESGAGQNEPFSHTGWPCSVNHDGQQVRDNDDDYGDYDVNDDVNDDEEEDDNEKETYSLH